VATVLHRSVPAAIVHSFFCANQRNRDLTRWQLCCGRAGFATGGRRIVCRRAQDSLASPD